MIQTIIAFVVTLVGCWAIIEFFDWLQRRWCAARDREIEAWIKDRRRT